MTEPYELPKQPRTDALVATVRERIRALGQDVWQGFEGEYLEVVTALDALAAELKKEQQFHDLYRGQVDDMNAELERVKAERDDYRDTSAAKEHAFRDSEARLDKALAALREIEGMESDGGTYEVVWDGVSQWVPKFKVIARAAIAEIDGEYDDIPGAGQRGCG